jgi:hypothetical protein
LLSGVFEPRHPPEAAWVRHVVDQALTAFLSK